MLEQTNSRGNTSFNMDSCNRHISDNVQNNTQNNTTLILQPTLAYKMSVVAFKNFAQEFNENKSLGKQLRSSHFKIMQQLYVFAQNSLRIHKNTFGCNMPINEQDDFLVKTNTVSLGKLILQHPDTVRRQIDRLIDSGAITKKINHGHKRDFDLYINHELVLIADEINPMRIVRSKYSSNANTKIQDSQTANCDLNNPRKEHYNNQLIDCLQVDNSNSNAQPSNSNGIVNPIFKRKEHGKEHFEKSTKSREVPEKNPKEKSLNAFQKKRQNEEKEILPEKFTITDNFNIKTSPNRYPEKEKKAIILSRYKKLMTNWLLSYALAMLWKNKTIYKAEYEKAHAYIESFYFNNLDTYAAFERKEQELRWRIDAVARYMHKHDYEMSLFPFRYFDLDNKTSGFSQTWSWYEKDKKYQKKKAFTKQKLNDSNKLHEAIQAYAKNPTIHEYKKQEKYVMDNVVYLKDDFYKHFKQI